MTIGELREMLAGFSDDDAVIIEFDSIHVEVDRAERYVGKLWPYSPKRQDITALSLATDH